MSNNCEALNGPALYSRPGFRLMKPESYELLLKTEKETGKSLPQIEDLSAGCLVAHISPVKGLLLLLSKSKAGNWGLPKGSQHLLLFKYIIHMLLTKVTKFHTQ